MVHIFHRAIACSIFRSLAYSKRLIAISIIFIRHLSVLLFRALMNTDGTAKQMPDRRLGRKQSKVLRLLLNCSHFKCLSSLMIKQLSHEG